MPPKETRGHRRPPIHPIIVFDETRDSSSRSISNDATTDTIIDHLGAPTTTTVNEEEEEENRYDSDGDIIMIDTTTAVLPPLLPPSPPEVEFLAPAPVLLLSTIASPEGKVDIDEDEDSTTGEHYYFFSLPGDYRLRATSPEINVDEGHEDVASLSYSESDEEVNSYNSDANDSVLIGEVIEEMDGLNSPTAGLIAVTYNNDAMNESEGTEEEEETDSSPPLLFAESTQVLLDEEVMIEDDGGSMTTAALDQLVNANHEGGAFWNEATSSTTAPLLGSIWVKHPKHGCMVRRSSRLIMLSRMG